MENIGKIIEILQAFKEGKTIEYFVKFKDESYEWRTLTNTKDVLDCIYKEFQVRIKKEQTYRPYANAEEFIKASKEHGGWISNGKRCIQYQFNPIATHSGNVYFYNPVDKSNESISYEGLLDYNFIWGLDGTPCGILEE